MGGKDDEDEAAELAAIEQEKKELAQQAETARLKATQVREKERIAAEKKAARLEREAEKARMAALKAAESTPTPATPAPTPTPAPERVVDPEVVPTKELVQYQAVVLALEQKFQMMEQKFDRKVEQVAETFADKIDAKLGSGGFGKKLGEQMAAEVAKKQPPFKTMFVIVCFLGIAALLVLRHAVKENSGAVAAQVGGMKDMIKELGLMAKSLSKAQRTLAAAQTVTSSSTISPEKKHSVVIANYKETPLKVYEVRIEGDKQMNKFICVIDRKSARQIAYDGDKTKLLVTGDVGDAGRTQPEDFSNGLWIWAFDDAANRGGLKTQDSAFMPK